MKITSPFLERLHLETLNMLLTARGAQLVKRWFEYLDVLDSGQLDDIAFCSFVMSVTDLPKRSVYVVFDMFDVDSSGSIEFDEFFLFTCMLIAIKDGQEKRFLWKHSRTCFELLDQDGSDTVSTAEFDTFGFIFDISKEASRKIFVDVDVDGNKELDYEEFRMFTLACLDKQTEINKLRKNATRGVLLRARGFRLGLNK